MSIRRMVSLAIASFASLASFADFTPPEGDLDVLIYTRWKYVRDRKTGTVVPKGAYHHHSTEVGAEEIRRYFTANGLKCLVTDKPEVFTSPAMEKVRCIVLACTNNELFNKDAEREAFYRFIENGGGLLAIHSASANERGQERFRKMLGGAFERHYATLQSVPFAHVDRAHPAMACMPAGYVWEKDEIYLNHPADDVRPLLILDWKDVLEVSRRGDRHGCPKIGGHVLEWCKKYGRGRIYYTALGHRPEDFGKMEWQLHLLNAARWAMGELPDSVEGDAKPKVRTTIEGCELVSGGKTVWRLNLATRESKPFIHPLCLPDGRCITEARPADHPWHLGLWFCWKYINGLNYWEPRDPAAGNLFPDGQTVIRDFAICPKGSGCDVSVDLWYGPRKEPGRVLLDEHREIAFSSPDEKGRYRIRSKHVFTAREKVTFDGRRPVGYGGFGLRMSAVMRGCDVLVDGQAVEPKRNEAVAAGAKEVKYVGPASGHGVSVRMLSPLPTERLYIWADRGFANPVPFYDRPVSLEKGEMMTLEYEVSVF